MSVNDDTLDMCHSGRKKIEYCAGGLGEMDIRSAFRNVLEARCARMCQATELIGSALHI